MKDRANQIRHMFARIATQYNKTNRWITWGQDVRWRREALDRARLPDGGKLLDIGTGTGDLVLEALQRDHTVCGIGADFTPEMMHQGRIRPGGASVSWVNSDALELPFKKGTFDAVVSGYLLRNVIDVERALAEQYRVVKPGGWVVCLDTIPPPRDLWHMPVRLYLHLIIPFLGRLIAGDVAAYKYLPASTESFIQAEELVNRMLRVGFKDLGYRSFMGGTMALHWGAKSSNKPLN